MLNIHNNVTLLQKLKNSLYKTGESGIFQRLQLQRKKKIIYVGSKAQINHYSCKIQTYPFYEATKYKMLVNLQSEIT